MFWILAHFALIPYHFNTKSHPPESSNFTSKSINIVDMHLIINCHVHFWNKHAYIYIYAWYPPWLHFDGHYYNCPSCIISNQIGLFQSTWRRKHSNLNHYYMYIRGLSTAARCIVAFTTNPLQTDMTIHVTLAILITKQLNLPDKFCFLILFTTCICKRLYQNL